MTTTARFPDLDGRSVFISGGGSGIGAHLTAGFLAQGARVAFVQRSDATAFCDAMEAAHRRRPLFLPCDVTDVPALEAAIGAAAEAHGPVLTLVNNAAWDNRHRLEETSVEDWDRLQSVNIRHHFFAAKAVAPGMRAAGGGTIVNYSSISYLMGNAGYPGYVAAKAGITGLTRALARELGPDRIRVNALLPGWTFTERQNQLWATDEAVAAHLARQCLPDPVPPEAMIGPTLFLASEASSVVTGQALVVDAGVVVTG